MEVRENNVKFHKNCENTVKILKILSVLGVILWKFDIYFLGLPYEIFFGVITDD